jgi:hypothetical protein
MVGGEASLRSLCHVTADAIPDKNIDKLHFANVDSLGGISTRVANIFCAQGSKYTP